MSDLISRSALIKAFDDNDLFLPEVVEKMINRVPTIEAVPVVHGYNDNSNYHEVDEFRCSMCGLRLEGWERHVYDEEREDEFVKEYAFKYCPECGAKMEGGAEGCARGLDINDWIYAPVYQYESLFKQIEKALGFKLFFWQKTYCAAGVFRRYGKTTAENLRTLLFERRLPLDYTEPPYSNRERVERNDLRVMQAKLEAAGIETRPIFWTKADKQRYAQKQMEKEQLCRKVTRNE